MALSIAVLGAVVYDEIITHDNQRIESYGGITYNVAALSSLVGDECDIVPVSNVGADRYDAVMDLIGSMNGVRTDGLKKWDGKLTHAQLIYRGTNYRDEFVRNMMRPFTLADLEPALECDGIIINFVNGTELDLPTLTELRRRTRAAMYLDMHNVMVRFGEGTGKQNFIDFSDWQEWVAQFDLVQMNEFECEKVLNVKPDDAYEYLDAAQWVLHAGPKAVFITMGPNGIAVAHTHEGVDYGAVVPVGPVQDFVDATGCGDAFSCGTFYHYLKTGSPLVAAMSGSLVGAVNCEVKGIGSLGRAKGADTRISEVSAEMATKIANGWQGLPLE